MERTYKILKPGQELPESRAYAIDLETTGLNPRKDQIVCASVACSDSEGYYVEDLSQIKTMLADPSIDKIAHNAVFDISFLRHQGYTVNGRLYCTQILSQLANSEYMRLGLKFLIESIWGPDYLEYDAKITEWLKTNKLDRSSLAKAPSDILVGYAVEDAINAFILCKHNMKQLRKMAKWQKKIGKKYTVIDYYHTEQMPIIDLVVAMRLRGIKVDIEKIAQKKEVLTNRVREIENKLTEVNKPHLEAIEKKLYTQEIEKRKKRNKSGEIKVMPPKIPFNWKSDEHLRMLLLDRLKLKLTKRTPAKKISVDKFVLEGLKDTIPWIGEFIEMKVLNKCSSTYLENFLEMQEGGVIYADFNITGTKTGRFSSSNPNLQNLPKEGNVKEVFIPRTKHFVYADYSQLELRIAAHASRDKLLIAAYNEERDIHQETADFLTKLLKKEVDRNQAKTVNFAIIYNASGWRIQDILGLEPAKGFNGRDTCKKGDKIIKHLFHRYKGLSRYIEQQKAFMMKYHAVVSPFGRVRRLPELGSTDRKKFGHAFRAGFNDPFQGFGASICKRAMLELANQGYSNFVSQIHDAIVLEVEDLNDKKLDQIRHILENVVKLKVPLKVDMKLLDSLEEK